ncbi:MAG: DUF1963 domain-containing protein [Mucilaginibacter sp.]
MGFFHKLFGKTNETGNAGGNVSLSPEQFLAAKYIKDITTRYKKEAILLLPHAVAKPVSGSQSKFGGLPNFNGFDNYPCCDSCQTPLNFVLQLYKKDFPAHYFPQNKNLFQLFRCPNNNCPDAYSEPFQADHKMFVYYFENNETQNKHFDVPQPGPGEFEPAVPDCILKPELIDDYPVYDDFDDVTNDIERIYGEELAECFMEEFSAMQRTKTGGYPSFTQPPFYPVCTCGKDKEFFFQLSSEDTEADVVNPVPDNWSPHHIMIGDLGNIYFYVCKSCGETSIESYWDCY